METNLFFVQSNTINMFSAVIRKEGYQAPHEIKDTGDGRGKVKIFFLTIILKGILFFKYIII